MTMRQWAVVDADGLVTEICSGPVEPAVAQGLHPELFEGGLPDRPVGIGFRFHLASQQWVQTASPALLAAAAAAGASRRRRDLLTDCDWTQGADSPLSAGIKAAWATYRQALRDITAQPGWPLAVVWPEPPGNAG